MKRPSLSTRIVGHPLVAVPIFLANAFVGGLYTLDEGFGLPSILALLFAGALLNCSKEASAYRAWRRDWAMLDPNYQPPQPVRAFLRFLRQLVVAVLAVGGLLWLLADYDDPTSPVRAIALTVAFGFAAVWLAYALLSRRQRKPTSREWIVTQAVTRPLPAPSAAEAYAWLPEYCRPLFTRDAGREEHA